MQNKTNKMRKFSHKIPGFKRKKLKYETIPRIKKIRKKRPCL
jgi:hypothetical protein